ncbi:Lsr2 family DNA-binding protein [Kitasatospora sp. NPDC054939]
MDERSGPIGALEAPTADRPDGATEATEQRSPELGTADLPVRAWARANGIAVHNRGRIPDRIRAEHTPPSQ